MKILRAIGIVAVGLMVMTGAMAPAMAASVRVTVNGEPITDTAINSRAGLLRLEGRGSSNSQRIQMATQELIDDTLKLQEAQRLKIEVTEGQVDQAITNLARNIKRSRDQLMQILTSNGVSPETLRQRLKAAIAWQGVTQQAVAPRVQISDIELEKEAETRLEETSSFDYMLKEIVFIIPKGSNISSARRTAEANQYRKNFAGCDSAVDLSLSYTDAAVVDVGRRHATQLPDAIAKELAGLQTGGITKPRVTDGGVSMLAVCSKAEARDLTFIKSELRQEQGADKVESAAEDYLKRLRERASISGS